MKRFLSLIAITGAIAVLSVGAFAQAAGPSGSQGQLGAGHGGAKGVNRWKVQDDVLAKMNLTQDQKDKIKALTDKLKSDIKTLRKGNKNATDDEKTALRQKVKDLNQQYQKDLLAIFTPDEAKQFRQLMREEIQKIRQQNQKNGGGTSAPAGTTPH